MTAGLCVATFSQADKSSARGHTSLWDGSENKCRPSLLALGKARGLAQQIFISTALLLGPLVASIANDYAGPAAAIINSE